jgi:hypothetical protein
VKDPAKIALFLHRVDKACARMNSGTTALAALTVMVVFMGALRASQIAIELGAAAAAAIPYSAMSSGMPIINPWN